MFSTLDTIIFIAYVIGLIALAAWISRTKNKQTTTGDYFLAGNNLSWWAIGASLIAANISAEQIIGMSGSGYVIGMAIASYEWMAAVTLIVVGKYFLPIFLKNKIYTMPQFLEQRFDSRVKLISAIFWLAVYIFVNLTAVLWLGALAIESMTGFSLLSGMVFLCVFSVSYSLYGGLKAVAQTDIIQVVLLVAGGFMLSAIALNLISEGQGVFQGFAVLTQELPEKFDMILSADSPNYADLPGLSVLLGGLWVMHFSYWGFNQYIIQRTLAAKSLEEGRKGILFAASLKILMPIIVVLPGICAVILVPNLDTPDQAYPNLLQLMPEGLRGLIFAALIAAIVSSLASMTNSISTIFTMDIYSSMFKEKSQKHLVRVGRVVSLVSLIVAAIIAKPLLGEFTQAFQFIQEFTGFFTPGVVSIFVLGIFWKKATSNAAISAAIGSVLCSTLFRFFLPELPFIDRVGIVFLMCCALIVIVSLWDAKRQKVDSNMLVETSGLSQTSVSYNLGATAVFIVLVVLYTVWW